MQLAKYEIEGAIQITELIKSASVGCDIDRMEIPPHTQMRLHLHRRFDEVFYVERGEGICQRGDVPFPIRAGDLFFVSRGVLHAVNTGHASLSVLTICLPSFDLNDVVYDEK